GLLWIPPRCYWKLSRSGASATGRPLQELGHMFRRHSDVPQDVIGARPREVGTARLEDQLPGLRRAERLLLKEAPVTLVNEQPGGMLDRFEVVLGPAPVPRMPETGHQTTARGRILIQ